MTRLLITQRRSAIGEKGAARGTLRALGLGRPGKSAHHEDGPQVRGMLRQVAHLVEILEIERGSGSAGPSESARDRAERGGEARRGGSEAGRAREQERAS
jgi:large subunit ribosomal protein L30